MKQENNSVNISDDVDIDNDGDTIDDLDNNNLVSHGIDVENEMSSDKVKGIDILISSNSKMIGITLCYMLHTRVMLLRCITYHDVLGIRIRVCY